MEGEETYLTCFYYEQAAPEVQGKLTVVALMVLAKERYLNVTSGWRSPFREMKGLIRGKVVEG